MNIVLRSLVTTAIVSAPAGAQVPCFSGDDGFAGSCCEAPHPDLPNFPAVVESGVYACVRECQVSSDFRVRVEIGAPEFYDCDAALIEIRVQPTTFAGPTISGRLLAKYSRTWVRTGAVNQQVWRFLLNGDWEFGPSTGAVGCPAPPHDAPSHVIGSIDYACDPDGTHEESVQIALNLSHLPGCLSHANGSVRPILGPRAHNDRSYHLIAPDNFSFSPINDISGRTRVEALRSSPVGNCFPWTYECRNEARVVDGELGTDFKNCLCTNLDGGPYVHSRLEGRVNCNGATSNYASVGNFNPVVPTGLVGLRLGTWIGPAWPGDLELTVYVGFLDVIDPCNNLSADLVPAHVTGVGTANVYGYLFGPLPTFQLFDKYVDLEDNLIPQTSNPIPYPGPLPSLCIGLQKGFGAPAYSSLVWNLNPTP